MNEPDFEREREEESHREDLRDGFAMNAMGALLCRDNPPIFVVENDATELARLCYRIADEMMRARDLT